MKLSFKKIALEEIDLKDKFFHYSDRRYDQKALLDSLRLYGVLFPVALMPKPTGFRLVTGFRRINRAKELALKDIPAYIIGKDTPIEEAFQLSLWENETTRGLNLFEKARALKGLEKAGILEEKILHTFMPLVRLPTSAEIKEDLLTLLGLPDVLVDYILSKNLSPKHFRHLKGLSPAALGLFASLVEGLLPAATVFLELTKGLTELSRKNEKELEEVAQSLGVQAILSQNSEDKKERLEKIRKLVAAEKFPTLTRINRELEEDIRRLEPPSFLKVNWDKTLERPEVNIGFNIKNEKELAEGVRELEKPEWKETLRKILDNL